MRIDHLNDLVTRL
jgi:hypothetical protein